MNVFDLLFNVPNNSLYDRTWCTLNKLADDTKMEGFRCSLLFLQQIGLPFRGTMPTGKVSQHENFEIVWGGVRNDRNCEFVYIVVDSEPI